MNGLEERSLSQADLYFGKFPGDNLPIIAAIALIVFFLLLLAGINYIFKQLETPGKKRKIVLLIFNLIFIIIFFSVMEWTSARTATSINTFLKNKGAIAYMDPLLFWRPAEHLSRVKVGDQWFLSTDSHGLRSLDETPLEKEPGEFRILVMGDSWVFGYGVDDTDTFCRRLEASLETEPGLGPVRIINGGRFGYCYAQGLIFLQEEAIRYNPDLIIVKNYLNRGYLKLFESSYPLPSSPLIKGLKSLLWKSRFYLYLRRMIYQADKKFQNDEIQNFAETVETQKYTGNILEEFNNFAIKRKIPVVFLEAHFNNGLCYDQVMQDFGRNRQVNYLEIVLDPALDKGFQKISKVHPGPKNHLRIAEKILGFLKEKKLIPYKK